MAVADTLDSAAAAELAAEEFGYFLGYPVRPAVDEPLYSPYDQSLRVVGPMGSGKTFRFLANVIRKAPGPGLFTSSKPDIYELTAGARKRRGPVVTFDPQGVVPGQEPLRYALIPGADDTQVAELRARAFIAGAGKSGSGDEAASFYRDQAADVLMCLLHAAALDGAGIRQVLQWARRFNDPAPRAILDHHPGAGPQWSDKLVTAVSGDERTVGNTRATLSRALAPFAHESVIASLDVDTDTATDIEGLVNANGSIYLLGKDSPHSSVSPIVTAIAEDVLDRAEKLAYLKPARRLDPPLLAALDEAANIAPLPSLRQRVADGRGRGLCVMYLVQAWASAVARFGKDDAKELAGYTNNLLILGGGKDVEFLKDAEQLCGRRDVLKTSTSSGRSRQERATQSTQPDREPVMEGWQIQRLGTERGHEGEALLLAGSMGPIITHLPLLSESPEWPQIQEEVAEIRRQADDAAARERAERLAELERHRATWAERNAGAAPVRMDKESGPDGS
ncbi:type IV secretory system conjugative DNA transfer family protein [Streptomyces kronopolitis]|uniref:type IV secretory system conjugative DNA transfer family protein n=1 Tax=Streptomyces kronopolitis TaxID=1612435 RepID=UPI003D9893E2